VTSLLILVTTYFSHWPYFDWHPRDKEQKLEVVPQYPFSLQHWPSGQEPMPFPHLVSTHTPYSAWHPKDGEQNPAVRPQYPLLLQHWLSEQEPMPLPHLFSTHTP